MSHYHRKKRRLSRRFRKKLYRILTVLNEFDFRRLRPLGIMLCAALAIFLLCLLPTSKTDNLGSPEVRYGEYLAEGIRRMADFNGKTASYDTIDVVALFLSGEDIAAFSSGSTIPSADTSKPLYSIYVTGEELYALAEGAVALFSAFPDTILFLSGLSYTYHPLRLPLNRITNLVFADGSEIAKGNNILYHVVATEELFSLLRSLAHRSQGIMTISPKDRDGVLLSDYSHALLDTEGNLSSLDTAASDSTAVSVVTKLSGLNLITLLEQPNLITLYIVLLFLAFIVLLFYCIPRMKRVRLWIRIYAIRRRKRGYVIFKGKTSCDKFL